MIVESAHRINSQFRDLTADIRSEVTTLRNAALEYEVESKEARNDGKITLTEQKAMDAQFEQVLHHTRSKLDAKIDAVHEYEITFSTELRNYRVWAWTLLALLTGAFFLTFYIFRTRLTRPFFDLEHAIRDFGSGGDYTGFAKEEGPAEFKMIAKRFNEMANNLRRQRQNHMSFLASVAHDLKNPIGGIKMSADLLSRKLKGEQPLVQVIQRQIMHLNNLVDDLLESSRIEAGNLELENQRQDLRTILQDAIQLYRSTTSIHQIRLAMPEYPLIIDCDRTRLLQVFNNLLSNAVKYSPKGGVISVDLNRYDGEAEIIVVDSGIGIAPDDLNRIFEPFLRTENVKYKKIPGVGLGLSTVKKIIQAHGGTIHVESKLNEGTKFFIRLPLRKKEPFPSVA